MQVIAKVRLFRSPYTTCYISEDDLLLPDSQCCKLLGVKCGEDSGDVQVLEKTEKKKRVKFVASAFFFQPFVKECLNSDIYRGKVLLHLNTLCGNPLNGTVFLNLILEPPDKEVIDYAW